MTPDRQFADQRLADLYDLGNAGSEDRDYYLNLAGEDPIDILDFGCGTGLMCLTYVARGHRVTGVDPARAMLNVARRHPRADRITWVECSSEDFSSVQRFDLIIMTGHAFQVLLSDDQVVATLRNMARHLKPEGRTVFESRNPEIDWDAIWAREYTMETPNGTVRATRRMTDDARIADQLSFAWDYKFEEETITSHSTLRFMSREQITMFAREAGLLLDQLHGDWDGSPFDLGTSREMIFKFRHGDAD